MALSGVHVVCRRVGARFNERIGSLPIRDKAIWSQTMPTAATTTEAAPDFDVGSGHAVFTIKTSLDVYVAIGPVPDASAGSRDLVRASVDEDIVVRKGDKLAWVAA